MIQMRCTIFPGSKLSTGLLVLGFLGLVSGCTPVAESNQLAIAVAANMQFAMEQLADDFSTQTGIGCDLVVASSGKLTAQIQEGAPYDVFISADMKYPQALYESGMAYGQAEVYARGRLVIWTLKNEMEAGMEVLGTDEVKHIALANPQTAPYGVATQEFLDHHQLWDSLSEKFVYGESIAQTNQFILSRSAEIGFTAMSVVLSPEVKGQGTWREVDPDLYAPIEQGIVLIRRKGTDPEPARRFRAFLFSPEARKVLEEFGYFVE